MLTPLTARVVGAMFALPGVVGLGIALEPRWSAARILLEAHACSIAMILIAAAVRLQVSQPQGRTALVSAALNHCNKWVHHESRKETLAPSHGTRDCPMNAIRLNRDRHSGGI